MKPSRSTPPVIIHWRKTKGLKPPCGKVSMYMADERSRVNCPTCLKAMEDTVLLEVKNRGISVTVEAGTREELDRNLGLAVATFPQSVNPTSR
jgi:hypothetical protein